MLSIKRVHIHRCLKRTIKGLSLVIALYFAIIVVGLLPANNGFRSAKNGVTIYVVSNAVHADIIVPCRHDAIDWREELQGVTFSNDVSNATHVAFGWGDQGFYLETPTWQDLKYSTAAKALFMPSNACIHVSFVRPNYYPNSKAVSISDAQYKRLVKHVTESLVRDRHETVRQLPDYSYSWNDAFLEAKGTYHLLNTCNSWAGCALRRAGVRCPWLSPLPGSPTMYFPQIETADDRSRNRTDSPD